MTGVVHAALEYLPASPAAVVVSERHTGGVAPASSSRAGRCISMAAVLQTCSGNPSVNMQAAGRVLLRSCMWARLVMHAMHVQNPRGRSRPRQYQHQSATLRCTRYSIVRIQINLTCSSLLCCRCRRRSCTWPRPAHSRCRCKHTISLRSRAHPQCLRHVVRTADALVCYVCRGGMHLLLLQQQQHDMRAQQEI